ncbi:MAG: hypothetical protein JW839_10580 [Candidatus Lokiarchaeota archaeon]|nr:hypothetical protein [Candidatus Lokiarchaeota archaeon]
MAVDASETFRVLLFSTLAAIAAIPATYLAYRAIRTRWHVLVHMGLALYFFAVTMIASYVIDTPDAIRALISLDYPLFLTWFVRQVYTRTPTSRRQSTVVFSAVMGLKVLHGANVLLFGVSFPARNPVPGPALPAFVLHAIVCASMMALSFAWYAINGYKAYHEALLRQAPKWVINRNKFVVYSAISYIFVPISWFLFPYDEAGFSSPLYSIPSAVALLLAIAFVTLTFLGWVAPEWFKRALDKDYARPTELTSRMDGKKENGQVTMQTAQHFTSSEIIGIVDYIGQYVADVTKQSPGAMKGLLLLALETQLHVDAVFHASFNEIESVVKGSFKSLLVQSAVEDPEAIVSKIVDFLANNKANLLMYVT